MQVKFEIPFTDFKKLVDKMILLVTDPKEHTGLTTLVRNHVIEKGRYGFNIQVAEAYDHEANEFTENGKVSFEISTVIGEKNG